MRSFGLLVVTLSLASACAADGPDDAGGARLEDDGTFGVVRIDRVAGPDPDALLPGAVVSAAFASHEGATRTNVARLLGLEHGSTGCELASGPDSPLVPDSARIELVDAGELELRVAGTRAAVSARTFPELGGIVAGVLYAEDTAVSAARAEVDEHVVAGRGSDTLAAFEVVAVAPPAVDSLACARAGAEPGPCASISRQRDLVLTWDAGDPRDRVEIEIGSLSEALRCVTRDDGALEIPEHLLASIAPTDDARLRARRVRRMSFDVSGLDEASLVLSTSSVWTVEVN